MGGSYQYEAGNKGNWWYLSVNDDLTERLVNRQVVHEGNYMTFAQDTVLDADGGKHMRDIVLHPGAVTIVAILADRRLLLVRQYRHAAGEALLELPAGTLDRQPDGSIENRLAAAKRELTEETAYRAGTWRELSTFFTAPGFASELMTMFLATDLSEDPAYKGPDADERLHLEKMPFDVALAQAKSGQMRDAKTILGVLQVDALARAGDVPELA
jgi:ADP-ribose pyrophosphatase